GFLLQVAQATFRRQRGQLDHQSLAEAAGESGGQIGQAGRTEGRRERQLLLSGQGAGEELDQRLGGAGRRGRDVRRHHQGGVAGGIAFGGSVALGGVEVGGGQGGQGAVGGGPAHLIEQGGDQVRLAAAGRAVQEQRVDLPARASRADAFRGAASGAAGRAI